MEQSILHYMLAPLSICVLDMMLRLYTIHELSILEWNTEVCAKFGCVVVVITFP